MGESTIDKILNSTVRLDCYNQVEQEHSIGTAFFMWSGAEEKKRLVLITNKHVVCSDEDKTKPYNNAKFKVTLADNSVKEIEIEKFHNLLMFHKSKEVDLCVININDKFAELINIQNLDINISVIETSIIPDKLGLSVNLETLEDVIMVGYPSGLYDEANNKPLIRRGITATSFNYNFCGKKEFLIDAICVHGSSGSPVFLKKEGLRVIGNGFGTFTEYVLIGVLFAASYRENPSKIVVKEIPCKLNNDDYSNLEPINIGYVIKSSRIIDIFENRYVD